MVDDGNGDRIVGDRPRARPTDRTWTRRGLIGGAAVVGAGAVVAVAKAPEAGATAGSAVLAGEVNTGAAGTALLDNIGAVTGDYILAVIDAAGGISSFPLSATVSAAATDDNTKAAVLGYAASTTLADGVHGRTDAGGKSGVSGEDRERGGWLRCHRKLDERHRRLRDDHDGVRERCPRVRWKRQRGLRRQRCVGDGHGRLRGDGRGRGQRSPRL